MRCPLCASKNVLIQAGEATPLHYFVCNNIKECGVVMSFPDVNTPEEVHQRTQPNVSIQIRLSNIVLFLLLLVALFMYYGDKL